MSYYTQYMFSPQWLPNNIKGSSLDTNPKLLPLVWVELHPVAFLIIIWLPSILAWRSPWTEEHGRPQSMGSQRVGQKWATIFRSELARGFPGGASGKESLCLPMQEMQEKQVPSLGREDPLEEGMATTPVFLPGDPMDTGAWWLQSMGPHRVGHDWSDLAHTQGWLAERGVTGQAGWTVLSTWFSISYYKWMQLNRFLSSSISTLPRV